MDLTGNWEVEYRHELAQGWDARRAGNEGRARVCARRAAGILVGEYLSRTGTMKETWNAYHRLQALKRRPGLAGRTLDIVTHLTMQVDLDHQLPKDVDLLVEVEELRYALLDESF